MPILVSIDIQKKGGMYFSAGPVIFSFFSLLLIVEKRPFPGIFLFHAMIMVPLSYCFGYVFTGFAVKRMFSGLFLLSIMSGLFWDLINFTILVIYTSAIWLFKIINSPINIKNINLLMLRQCESLLVGFFISAIIMFIPICWIILFATRRQWIRIRDK
jgi:hypothetical protein